MPVNIQMIQANKIDQQAFYDNYSRKFLVDYVYGNPRVVSAIKYTLGKISKDVDCVLDIGCGIGWSSHEIKRHFALAQVTGVDIGVHTIELAQRLFRCPNLTFHSADVTCDQTDQNIMYNAVVMLDVYEHIPANKRAELHAKLRRIMRPGASLVMTFPSVKHQEFLRQTNPSGLQPVDEYITRENINNIASDIDAVVDDYSLVNIWQQEDYVHATLRRRGETHRSIFFPADMIALETKQQRFNRVKASLAKKITKDGLILASYPGPTICIVAPEKDAYSETFIRSHIENLPTTVRLLYDGFFPTKTDEGKSLVPSGCLLGRVIYKCIRKVLYKITKIRLEHLFLQHFLRKNHVRAVLTEYGVTGMQVMECCQKAGIPLVVHFHGYDAYASSVVQGKDCLYPELFKIASAIIVVSRDMEHQLKRLGAPKSKIFYNVCGVETTLFQGANPMAANPVFLAVGRFVNKKAPHLTLSAFRIVLKKHTTARMIFVGDGPLLESCKQLARAWNIDYAVDFKGVCSHTEVASLMRKSRVFVQHSLRPSDGDSEGTPVAVLEACSSGLPVVATRHGGIPDVILEGKTGFLVSEGDVEDMAKYMLLLAQDSKLAAQLGQAGREYIQANFDMKKRIDGLWRIISGVINKDKSLNI